MAQRLGARCTRLFRLPLPRLAAEHLLHAGLRGPLGVSVGGDGQKQTHKYYVRQWSVLGKMRVRGQSAKGAREAVRGDSLASTLPRQACSQPGQEAAQRPGWGRGSQGRVRGNGDRGVTRLVPGLLADQGEESGFHSE